MKNILEWLERSAESHGENIVYIDQQQQVTFAALQQRARAIGSRLDREMSSPAAGGPGAPVAVFCGRSAWTPAAFLGVVYSGRAYAPLDSSQPAERLERILNNLQPALILADRVSAEALERMPGSKGICRIIIMEDIWDGPEDEVRLDQIREEMTALDPLYIIHTSGSTGQPKGVVTSHDALIRYLQSYRKVMEIDGSDRLGNQSPLDYIAAIRDIYLPLMTGCSCAIIPKEYFMMPTALFEFMNRKEITCVGWSVSAFTIPVTLGAFEEGRPESLRKVCFSGSVMPGKCLRIWQQNLPEARFVNQYGPTEGTASCTYYVVDHPVAVDEVLPVGRAYDHYRVFILREDGTEAAPGEAGEICIGGPCLALGYYNDPERTAAAFVQNPLNPYFQERIYRTGDIGLLRPDGLLEFHGRRDRQIKHMGHRVELDEIELAALQISGVEECCCLYQHEKEKLHLFYSGAIDKKSLLLSLRNILPGFMIPRGVKQLDALPKLANGKIDINTIKERIRR